jgi:ATP-dependent exoDNAse (exonuclease V) beta subunit
VIDSAAREAAIAANASVLVQAPAGSGKTTLLTQRFLRLLSLVDAPERILALTFTRRAAQEMRERVLEALRSARLAHCPHDMNARTWGLALEAARRMQSLGFDLESQASRLRIETIDAFNAWLQSQMPISAGSGAGMRVQEDARASYREAARRALAHEEPDGFGAAVERVLELDDQRWRGLVALIGAMLPSRDRWLPLLAGRLQTGGELDAEQLRLLRRHFDEDLRLLVTRSLAQAHTLIGEERLRTMTSLLGGAARRLNDDPQLASWREPAGPLRAEAADAERWRCAAAFLLTARGKVRKNVTKQHGFPPGCADKPAMTDLLQELARDPAVTDSLVALRALPEPAYSDAQWERVRDVAQVLLLAAAQLEVVFREQGAVDFPAVAMAALRSLGSPAAPTDLTLRLDYRLQHILVDEFQDTSSAQLELLRLLTAGWQRGDGHSLFCVGDPMQSIYGFRRAEVRAFLELAEEGIGEVRFEVQRLQSNFRSTEPLVSWINSSFARILPGRDDRARGAIAFRPSAALLEAAADEEPAVQLLQFGSRDEEAATVADMVADATRLHPHWRVAVLVRARSHAWEIAAGLRSRGVAFRASNIEALKDRSIVRDILVLARALLHRADRIAWLALLRGPWAGLSLADLLPIARAPLPWDAIRDETLLRQLSEDGRARCARLAAGLGAAFQSRGVASTARWIESTWLRLGGPASAASAEDLDLAAVAFERLRVLDEQGMPDAAELPLSFADLFANQAAPSAVEIMTIHKAKGLEFDLVVVPSLDRAVPRGSDQLLLLHEFARTGRDGMIMAARPPVGARSDKLFEFLQRQARDAAGLEAQRLLYVACTRAKRQLWLTAKTCQPDAAAAFTPHPASLLAELWPMAEAEFKRAAAPVVAGSDAAGSNAAAHAGLGPAAQDPAAAGAAATGSPSDGAPRGGPLHRLPLSWSGAPPPASPAIDAPAIPREPWPIFDWASETARRVGTLVHAQLRTLHPASIDERDIRAREPSFERWLANEGVPPERLRQAASRVTQALLAVHADARGRWILASGYRDDLREHALSGSWNGEIVRAVFDRSFIDEGIRWVIDYKTSQHLGGAVDEFLDREVARYQAQLQRYARLAQKLGPEPVRLGLYFPLMRAWREWSPQS